MAKHGHLQCFVLFALFLRATYAQSPTPAPTANCSDAADYCSYVTSYCNTTFCFGCVEAHVCDFTCGFCSDPTPAPTFAPTSIPSFPPTPSPSLLPSSLPTTSPSSVPLPAPTPVPTSLPTAEPTHIPTPQPSPSPTLIPTPVPTRYPRPKCHSNETGTPSLYAMELSTGGPSTGWGGASDGVVIFSKSTNTTVANFTVIDGRSSDFKFLCLSDGCYVATASSQLTTAYWTLTADASYDDSAGWTQGDLGVEELLTTSPKVSKFCVSTGTFEIALTSSPTISPAPTFSPSPQPTSRPTPQPTPLPTPTPSPLPTAQPTPLPTAQPSILPTPLPTLKPTPLPTAQPSPVPTSYPSQVPTAAPSVQPTPVPSPFCYPGTQLVDNVCTNCIAGRYSNFTAGSSQLTCELCPSSTISAEGASGCTACASGKYANPTRIFCASCSAGTYVDSSISECINCPLGKFNPVAQTDFCTTCSPGSATNKYNGSATCSSCGPGTYNLASAFCQDCPVGQYSGTRADRCSDCEAGTYTDEIQSASCTSCDAGRYSTTAAQNCTLCAAGYYSLTRASECILCPVGTYNNAKDASSCTACPSGKYANETGKLECDDCEIGEYQGATSQSNCEKCEAGKYVNQKGQTFCKSCETGYHSVEGDDDCSICEEGYYWGLLVSASDRQLRANYSGYGCETCPDNCKCEGGVNAGDKFQPKPLNGYWIDRSAVAKNPLFIRSVYKCSRDTCSVDIPSTADSTSRRLSSTADCDLFENYTSLACQSSDILCKTGSEGPLCGACSEGYTFSTTLSRCSKCGGAWVQVIIVLSVAVGAFILMWSIRTGEIFIPGPLQSTLGEKWRIPIIGVIASIDSGALKLLWSTFQIVQSVSFNLNVTFPYPYTEITKWLSFIQLDFLNIDCLQGSFYLNVYMTSAFPMILAAVCWSIYAARYSYEQVLGFISSHHKKEVLNELWAEHMHAFLLLIYIFVPPVANTQFKALDCQELDDGQSYVRTDTSVDCKSDAYKSFVVYDAILIVIFQCLPLLYIVLLCRVRDRLRPKTANPALALEVRDQDESLKSVQFLFKDYKCNRWYFEIADMYRRIIFVSVISLIDSKSSTRAYAGCGLALLSTIYFRELTPFRVEFTNFLAVVAQYVILLAYMAALMIGTDSLSKFNISDFGMGCILSSMNFLIVGMALFIGWRRYKRDQQDIKLRTAKPIKIEYAADFTENKFNTTFEFVTQRSLPASHVLCFYYTSMSQAHDSIRLGNIPALNKDTILGSASNAELKDEGGNGTNPLLSSSKFSGGVLVSLRGPQVIKAEDSCLTKLGPSDVTASREAVLCLALPHAILYTLPSIPGVDEDTLSHMRLVPADLLHAMGTYVPPPKPKALTRQQRKSTVVSQDLKRKSVAAGGGLLPTLAVVNNGEGDEAGLMSPEMMDLNFKEARRNALSIPTKCVLRAYQLVHDKMISSPSLSYQHLSLSKKIKVLKSVAMDGSMDSGGSGSSPVPLDINELATENALVYTSPSLVEVSQPRTCSEFVQSMNHIRGRCEEEGLVPLYHYTMPAIAPMILKGGFRMSTQGQGDGGVYFSTLGPSSYELGSDKYEENIIIDCFGKERLEEYRGKHKLDLMFVYGVNPKSVEQAPGGRENAKMVGKAMFEDLSLPASDGNYFLRPDMIRGAFLIDPVSGYPEGREDALDELEGEKRRDREVQLKLKKCSEDMKRNSANTKEARLLRGMYINDETSTKSSSKAAAAVKEPTKIKELSVVKSPRNKPAPRVSPSKYEEDDSQSVDSVSSKSKMDRAILPKKKATPRKKASPSRPSGISSTEEATL